MIWPNELNHRKGKKEKKYRVNEYVLERERAQLYMKIIMEMGASIHRV